MKVKGIQRMTEVLSGPPKPFFIALRIPLEQAVDLSSIKMIRVEPFVCLQPVHCFFQSIDVARNISDSLGTLRVKLRDFVASAPRFLSLPPSPDDTFYSNPNRCPTTLEVPPAELQSF
jgi:hypothetical protein